jgi:hypothetical protein
MGAAFFTWNFDRGVQVVYPTGTVTSEFRLSRACR